MKQWWRGLQQQERRTISIGCIALLLMGLYFGLWEPFNTALVEQQAQLKQQQATRDWLKRSQQRVRQLEAQQTKNQGLGQKEALKGSLLALVDQTVKQQGLSNALRRLEPAGKGQVRVWLTGVSFDKMIDWLLKLQQRYPVTVALMTVDRQAQAGLVNARFTLQGAE